jgi:hypothetical protein
LLISFSFGFYVLKFLDPVDTPKLGANKYTRAVVLHIPTGATVNRVAFLVDVTHQGTITRIVVMAVRCVVGALVARI